MSLKLKEGGDVDKNLTALMLIFRPGGRPPPARRVNPGECQNLKPMRKVGMSNILMLWWQRS